MADYKTFKELAAQQRITFGSKEGRGTIDVELGGGLGSRPTAPNQATEAPQEEQTSFYERMYDKISSYFTDPEEADKVLLGTGQPEERQEPDSSLFELRPLREVIGQPSQTELAIPTLPSSRNATPPFMYTESSVDFTANGKPVQSALDTGGADVEARAARTRSSIEEAGTERMESRASFFRQVAEDAEGFHGNTPQVSNDDLDAQTGQTTYDIGYGHKITPAEFASGEIHGVQFIDSDGNYIPLTDEQIDQITTADFRMHEERAKNTWRPIFEEMSTPERTYTWDSLDTPYQNVLTSLHYNVRRPGQFRQVVREAIRASEVVNDGTPEGIAREREAVRRFAEQLRRKNAGVNTAGMDNRVVKELYFAGLIDSHADVSSVLNLANPEQTGIPATADYGSNPNRRPSGSQD